MNPSSALGRVVILKNIGSKPELNSRYANVEEYNSERNRYLVHIIDHSTSASSMSAWVTEDKFDFVHPRVYTYLTDLRELAIDDKHKLLAKYHKDEDSLDHSDLIPEYHGRTSEIWKKGVIFGAVGGGVDENGLYLPTARICHSIDVKLNNSTDTLEIEDVYFNITQDPGGKYVCVDIECGTVIFRRCRFDGVAFELWVEGTTGSLPHAILENCVFKTGCICQGGSASFLNCFFRNSPKTSTSIQNESYVNVEHCDIRGAITGVMSNHMHPNAKQSKVSHCIIRDVEDGIFLFEGSFIVHDCRIINASLSGASITNSTCDINRCEFRQCDVGVYVGAIGSTLIADSAVLDCHQGIQVAFDFDGIMLSNRCFFSGNRLGDIMHYGLSSKSVVLVDGSVFKRNASLPASAELSRYVALNPENDYSIRRSLKTAGLSVYSPLCGHCGAQESEDRNQKFRRCARCTTVVYCSRECQVALISVLIVSAIVMESCVLYRMLHGRHMKQRV